MRDDKRKWENGAAELMKYTYLVFPSCRARIHPSARVMPRAATCRFRPFQADFFSLWLVQFAEGTLMFCVQKKIYAALENHWAIVRWCQFLLLETDADLPLSGSCAESRAATRSCPTRVEDADES